MSGPPPPPVVLASTSAARRALLEGAGVVFSVASPGVDEEGAKAALLGEGASSRDIADALAELKAVRASMRHPGLVIGADQTLDLDGAVLSKPESLDAARAQLEALRGRPHRLHSAVVVAQGGRPIWRELSTATLKVRPFSDAFLDAYLAGEGERATATVGSYRLEGPGVQLFGRIEGDYFAILGLPLLGLLDLLRRHGALAT